VTCPNAVRLRVIHLVFHRLQHNCFSSLDSIKLVYQHPLERRSAATDSSKSSGTVSTPTTANETTPKQCIKCNRSPEPDFPFPFCMFCGHGFSLDCCKCGKSNRFKLGLAQDAATRTARHVVGARLSNKSAVFKPADEPEVFRSANQLRSRNK
jgi:hypothetical protein